MNFQAKKCTCPGSRSIRWSISLAAKLAEEFDGKLRISYSGGADFHNIKGIVDAGIWPVTVATTLLKPGGYDRMAQMASLLEEENAVSRESVQKKAGKTGRGSKDQPVPCEGGEAASVQKR